MRPGGFCIEEFSAPRGHNGRSDAEMWEEGDRTSSALCPSGARSAIGYSDSTSCEVTTAVDARTKLCCHVTRLFCRDAAAVSISEEY